MTYPNCPHLPPTLFISFVGLVFNSFWLPPFSLPPAPPPRDGQDVLSAVEWAEHRWNVDELRACVELEVPMQHVERGAERGVPGGDGGG